MSSLAGQQVVNFGYDNSNSVSYKFNSIGFRSPEHCNRDSVIVVGNSISFGIGLAEEETYGYQIAKQLDLGYINCSLGCYLHENHDHLLNLRNLANRTTNDLFLIQFNNLDRQRISNHQVILPGNQTQAVEQFVDYFSQVELLLQDKQKFYLYWDEVNYALPPEIKNKLLIHNNFHHDTSLSDNTGTFGPKTHLIISKIVLSKLAQLRQRGT